MAHNDIELITAEQVIIHMESLADERQAQHLMRFFKTGEGDYGNGDQFLGIKVPVTRSVVTRCRHLPFNEVDKLLASPWHEVRLCGLLVLVAQFEAQNTKRKRNDADATHQRDAIVKFYLNHASCANNWDLVDLSVYKILGEWLVAESSQNDEQKLKVIDHLASSDNLWEQRMSMVCTLGPLKHGDPQFTLRYAERHLHHPHDLMHKAVGWMLREMGKRVSLDLLRDFLCKHVHEMPRTALRYAIEHLSDEERLQWMAR